MAAGIPDVTLLDSRGIIHSDRGDLTEIKAAYAARTNPRGTIGGSAQALDGADVFIGVSSGTIPEETLEKMSEDAIIFALSNPDPEVHPETAAKFAKVVATGRSDFPNQINNVLAFPGIFRGALDAGARRITSAMKVAGGRRNCRHRGGRPCRRLHHSQPAGFAGRSGGYRRSDVRRRRRLTVTPCGSQRP